MTDPRSPASERLRGARCLVTGGSRNLGRALCLGFARAGARVAFTYQRHTAEAEETRAALARAGAESRVFQGSVADADHARRVVDDLCAALGRRRRAGQQRRRLPRPPHRADRRGRLGRGDAVNVKGAYLFTRACLRPMLRAGAGRILNIGAFAVDRVSALPVAFAASKGALEAMTRALAREVGRYGVRVNCLDPGLCEVGHGRAPGGPAPRRIPPAGGAGPAGQRPTRSPAFAVWLSSPRTRSCRARPSRWTAGCERGRALVFGGSRIRRGGGVARLAARGVRATFTYRRKRRPGRRAGHGAGARARACDLRVPAEVRALAEEVRAGADLFIHCATIGRPLPSPKQPRLADETYAVNVRSAYVACQALLPDWATPGGGDVVVLTYVDGAHPTPMPAYFALTQTAVVGLVRALAKEFGRGGVRANAVQIGPSIDGVARELPVALLDDFERLSAIGRAGTAEDVARAIASSPWRTAT